MAVVTADVIPVHGLGNAYSPIVLTDKVIQTHANSPSQKVLIVHQQSPLYYGHVNATMLELGIQKYLYPLSILFYPIKGDTMFFFRLWCMLII